jgi:hypothetical protein
MLDQFPIKPPALMAAKGWQTSIDMAFEVIGGSATMARLVLKRGTASAGTAARSRRFLRFMAGTRRSSCPRPAEVTIPAAHGSCLSRLSPLIPPTWLTFPARVPEPLPFNATALG